MEVQPFEKPSILSVVGLRRVYGPLVALDSFDLVLNAGECVALMGPNGCGKTTTLSMVAGLAEPSEGRVEVGGFSIHDKSEAPSARALLATVLDNPLLYEDLTVREHLELVAMAHGVGGPGLDEKIDLLLERLHIGSRADAIPRELSRGMRQKVQIACAFIRPFELLVLDEPVVGLDQLAVATLRDMIREVVASGCAVLMSTHQPSFAEAVDARIIALEEGCVVAPGRVEQFASVS